MDIRSQIEYTVNEILSCLPETVQQEHFLQYISKYSKTPPKTNEITSNDEILMMFDQYHSIYYNKTSSIYYNYNGKDYILFNEDNMLHLVLEYISTKTGVDTSQKNGVKNKLFKQIKENNIYEAIPDSRTIQSILNYLNQTLFNCKAYSKIFLILIGSIILKKKTDNKFLIFTRTNMKSFLTEFNQAISIYFCNTNLFNFFKFKYTQDHDVSTYSKYLLHCNNINCDIMKTTSQLYVNMAVVAIYYFNRYSSVENYITTENISSMLKNSIYYFDIEKSKHIQKFIDTHITKDATQEITQRELTFLWKKYVLDNDIFVSSFSSYTDFVFHLFKSLDMKYDSGSTNNVLIGYCSLESPRLDNFKKFWNDNFVFCDKESHLEINEILFLYNKHNKGGKSHLSESLISLIIQCFYSQFEIIDNKMIHNVKCLLWDKRKEIDDFIQQYDGMGESNNINSIYKKYISTKTDYRISKIYFQKYLTEKRKSKNGEKNQTQKS